MAKSLLIVDDHPQIRKAIRSCFESDSRFQVCGEAADGLEAVEKTAQLRPDLVVLDIVMPRMNGMDAARLLRSMMPALPIIAFTWYVGSLHAADLRAAGINAIVSKSDFTALVKHVESALQSPGAF